jgi:hypothetical protein
MQNYFQLCPKRYPLRKKVWAQNLAKVLGSGILLRESPFLILRKNPNPGQAMRNTQLCFHPNSCQKTKTGSDTSFQSLLWEGHDRLVFNGTRKPHSSTYSPSVSKTFVSGTQKSVTEHKAKKSLSHPSHSKPDSMVTPHNKAKSLSVRQPGNKSNSALGSPAQELLAHIILALCPGTRIAAPAQDLSCQSVGLRS